MNIYIYIHTCYIYIYTLRVYGSLVVHTEQLGARQRWTKRNPHRRKDCQRSYHTTVFLPHTNPRKAGQTRRRSVGNAYQQQPERLQHRSANRCPPPTC